MSTATNGASRAEETASAQPAPLVRFEAVRLARGPEGAKGLSFALAPGSFHMLCGAPGAGKSEILRLMALAEAPAQGRVQLFGRDVAALGRAEAVALRRRIGHALQPPTFIDHLSVWQNLALGPRVTGRRARDFAGETDELLAWTGLADRADAHPRDLTEGERDRLAFARAAAARPELLLVDEGDPATRARLLKLAGDLHKAGATVVMATRDPVWAAAAGHPVLRLQEGRITLAEAGA